MRKFVLATANPHKIKEIRAILSQWPIALLSLSDFPPFCLPGETGESYEENAVKKALYVAEKLQLPALGDDSGLEVEALPGQLGVQSSRFLGETTGYAVKNERILSLLKNVPVEKRKAKFVCVAAVALPDGSSRSVRGEVEGTISFQAQGEKGFGYDPVFFVPDLGKTMAQFSAGEKNKISHRAIAFRKLAETFLLQV